MSPRRPRDIGTVAETATVRYLQGHGFPHAERRQLRGALDAGDITGTPGICWEVKGGAAAQTASDGLVAQWIIETERERVNAGADCAVLVLQRKGIGPQNAGRWWAIMPAFQYLRHGGSIKALTNEGIGYSNAYPVRMALADCVAMLVADGYGQHAVPQLTSWGTEPVG